MSGRSIGALAALPGARRRVRDGALDDTRGHSRPRSASPGRDLDWSFTRDDMRALKPDPDGGA